MPATQQYRMTATGSGMDSALLTEKDIRGRVDFDAQLQGKGASGGYAEGNFRMGEGSFSGIPFLSMTGDFVKQGEQMSFQNVVVNTVGGSFRAEGFSEGSVVQAASARRRRRTPRGAGEGDHRQGVRVEFEKAAAGKIGKSFAVRIRKALVKNGGLSVVIIR